MPARGPPFDRDWFVDYDAIITEVHSLRDLAQSQAEAKEKHDAATQELAQATKLREKNDAMIKEQEDRIELVGSHWFFGTTALQPQLWFRGGTQGKIERAKAKLERAKSDHEPLIEAERALKDGKVAELGAEVKRLLALSEHKAKLETESKEMREHAVKSNPSDDMKKLEEEIETLTALAADTGSGAEGLKALSLLYR